MLSTSDYLHRVLQTQKSPDGHWREDSSGASRDALDESFLAPIQYMYRRTVRGVTEWAFTTDSVVPASEVERSWKTICTSPDEKR